MVEEWVDVLILFQRMLWIICLLNLAPPTPKRPIVSVFISIYLFIYTVCVNPAVIIKASVRWCQWATRTWTHTWLRSHGWVCARVHACVWESVYVLQRAWHCSVTYITLYLFAQSHTDKLNTQVALHQLYQYASKYYDGVSFTPGLFRTAFSFKVGNKTQSGVLLWQNNQDTLSPAPFILSLLSHSSLPRMAVY